MTHPYSDLNTYNFWYKSVSAVHPGQIDPVVNFRLISKSEKISTMGSCFAQHLSKNIQKSGFNYFVSETPPDGISNKEATNKNYGVFSARYGNVYTSKQALQLFERAFDESIFCEHIWQKNDRFVDAFRPNIDEDGFLNEAELLADRKKHLGYVRQIFLESDWLIFTLGLTEAWRSKSDGAIFPIAPGVAGGKFDSNLHEFVNFGFNDVVQDLETLISKLKSINPKIKILLTISPVPLIATYENRHVLVSTVASKSILRAAADDIERKFKDVVYFPSYEIIVSQANSGRYFGDDLREVTELGVNHVMRIFAKHFIANKSDEIENQNNKPSSGEITAHNTMMSNIVCDEELIIQAVKDSNF